MTDRDFPSAFDQLPAFLVYEPKADGDFTLWGFADGEWKKGSIPFRSTPIAWSKPRWRGGRPEGQQTRVR